LSRSPLYVGLLGLVYGRAGRPDDAMRLLHELEERAARGEYVPAFTVLPIHIALGDLETSRHELKRALAEETPPLSLHVTTSESLRAFGDAEIDRMLFEFFGW
jgi:hypothetical protein